VLWWPALLSRGYSYECVPTTTDSNFSVIDLERLQFVTVLNIEIQAHQISMAQWEMLPMEFLIQRFFFGGFTSLGNFPMCVI
jgi:hypothetical protein